jgi:signal peptidase II
MTESNVNQKSSRDGAGVPSRKMPSLKEHLVFWPIVIIGTVFDLWTKQAVFEWLKGKPNQEVTLIDGLLKFVIGYNRGAAFGIAQGQTILLISISAIALIVVLVIFLSGRLRGTTMHIGLGLFTAGIIGNLYDRAFNDGCVRDFIDVLIPIIYYPWPTFNVADSMLCVAVGLMIIANLTSPSSQKPSLPQKQER